MNPSDRRKVAAWLLVCAALTFAVVVVGGVTRLTESGLSITEWQPVSGIVPPLSQADWDALFAKYRDTPQFKKVFGEITLEGFKGIFWLEYVHRLLGRLIGLVFLLPYLFFLLKRKLGKPTALKLAGVFILGALQGVLGWYMVESGLVSEPRVSHFRLTAHLGLALLIFSAEFWIALSLLKPETKVKSRFAATVAILVYLMILSGGMVAGLRAGHAYNTFPLMNGYVIPPETFQLDPWWENFFWNIATVQLVHRTFFWLLLFLVPILWFRQRTIAAHHLLGMFFVQAGLGITTLLNAVPIPIAACHQAGAVLLLATALWTARSAP